jgi:hypothetical protein
LPQRCLQQLSHFEHTALNGANGNAELCCHISDTSVFDEHQAHKLSLLGPVWTDGRERSLEIHGPCRRRGWIFRFAWVKNNLRASPLS